MPSRVPVPSPVPVVLTVRHSVKWTCLMSSGRGLWVGCLGTPASPVQWQPYALIQFLSPNKLCGSLATAASPAGLVIRSLTSSSDHSTMLEDVITVTLLRAIGKDHKAAWLGLYALRQLLSQGRANPGPQLTAGSCAEDIAFQQRCGQSSGGLGQNCDDLR